MLQARPGIKRTPSGRRATVIRASILKSAEHDTENVEPPEKKKKRQFDYMTSDVLGAKQKHLLAGRHYSSLGNIVFVVSALMTLLQATLATLAQAKNTSEIFQSNCNIAIALLSAFSVFWQSFAKHWDYSGKAGLHDSASKALAKIYNVANLRAREQQAVCKNGEEGEDADDVPPAKPQPLLSTIGEADYGPVDQDDSSNIIVIDDEGEEDVLNDPLHLNDNASNAFQSMTQQFEQATEGCNSMVPVKITAAFEILDARIGACKKEIVNRGDQKTPKVKWEKVLPSLYTMLTTTIISSFGWPYLLPNPEKVVDKTMEKYQLMNTNLLESLLNRRSEIDKLWDRDYASESTSLIDTI